MTKATIRASRALLAVLLMFASCSKDDKGSQDQANSKIKSTPVALAGADTLITASSCPDTFGRYTLQLDASRSYDTLLHTLFFSWRQIKGPTGQILNSGTAVTQCDIPIAEGDYAFEVTVMNFDQRKAKDTTLIRVRYAKPDSADVDMTVTGDFQYEQADSIEIYPLDYVIGNYFHATIDPPVGGPNQFLTRLSEFTDTGTSDSHDTRLLLEAANQKKFIRGSLSVNFKKLIRQGGGDFSGTCEFDFGNTQPCFPDRFNSLPLLQVNGRLSLADSTITMRIKGKIMY